jgi:UDP-glucuronate 4-epimerase
MNRILVTGAAGFIGFHYALRLLREGQAVTGIDNLNDYYSVQLKQDRLKILHQFPHFRFEKVELADQSAMTRLFQTESYNRVIHLAAQAGVRYSITNPRAYVDSNLVGFINILEGCRGQTTPHLVYASSSSVYGSNKKQPFATTDSVDHPISLYAATKKANELMAHTYSHLYDLPTTGLRFFTVYGPWGRPDMALFKFTEAICQGRPIDVYNHGKLRRDFTYIDDIVESMIRISDVIPARLPKDPQREFTPNLSDAPYRVYNIGNHSPVELNHFIECIENALGMKAQRNLLPMQPGDVEATYADVEDLEAATGFKPQTSIEEGIRRFTQWYREYHQS